MNDPAASSPPEFPSHNPGTEPGPPPSTWPTLFGILALVFGAFGCLGAVLGILGALTTDFFNDFQAAAMSTESGDPEAQEMLERMQAEANRWKIPNLIISIALLGLGAVLIIGGIKLLQRSFSARKLLIPWAWAKIAVGTISSVVGLLAQKSQTDAMMAEFNTAAGSSGGAMPSMDGIFTTIFGLFFFLGVIWVCALPVIFLIWLNRDPIREDMRTWKDAPSPGPGA